MKKLFLLIVMIVSCFCSVVLAGNAFKMVQSDHGETAHLWLADQIEKSLKEFPSGDGRIADSRGATPQHFLMMLKEAGHYQGDLSGMPTYLRTLKWKDDPDREKVFTLSRIVLTKQGKIEAWLDWKRQINTAGEGVFVDSEGNYVLAGLCLNVIKKEKIETLKKGDEVISVQKKELCCSQFFICDCEPNYVPVSPFTLKTSQVDENGNIQEVVLTHPGDKIFIHYWIEDANGKKVLPLRDGCNFIDRRSTDENRRTHLDKEWFDERTCKVLYTKAWDRNWNGDGLYWPVECVDGHSGTITFTVPALPGQKIEIPWRVEYNPNKKSPSKKNFFSKEFKPEVDGIISVAKTDGSLEGKIFSDGKIFLEHRVMELETLSGNLVYHEVAQNGEFYFKNIPSGEYFLKTLYAREDDTREITPEFEFEIKIKVP